MADQEDAKGKHGAGRDTTDEAPATGRDATGDAPVALVTGATSGIGVELTRGLVQAGFAVTALARDATKAEALVAEMAPIGLPVTIIFADLSSLAQIRAAAAVFLRANDRLDLLVNNAGIVKRKRTVTGDGIEATFAVNHLAYMLLTDLVLDRLRRSAPARIVSTSSAAHYRARLDPDDLEMARGRYSAWRQYCNSKLLNVLWTRELARRLEGTGVVANCFHPGVVATRLARDVPLGNAVFRAMGVSATEGAKTGLWLSTDSDTGTLNGTYCADRRVRTPSPEARDDALSATVWKSSLAYLESA